LQENFPKIGAESAPGFVFLWQGREREKRERERERARAENVQGTQKLGNRRQAFNARCDRLKDGRTDGRADGWMGDSTRAMTDGCFNAVTAVEKQSFLRSFPFSPESLNGLLHRATLFTRSPKKPSRGYY